MTTPCFVKCKNRQDCLCIEIKDLEQRLIDLKLERKNREEYALNNSDDKDISHTGHIVPVKSSYIRSSYCNRCGYCNDEKTVCDSCGNSLI